MTISQALVKVRRGRWEGDGTANVMTERPLVGTLGSKISKIPSFTVKNASNRHPPKRWVLFMSWHFVSSSVSLSFFPPDSSYFPQFLDALKPQNGPQMGVIGNFFTSPFC